MSVPGQSSDHTDGKIGFFAVLLGSLLGDAAESSWAQRAMADLYECDGPLAETIKTIREHGTFQVVLVPSGESLLGSLRVSLQPLRDEAEKAPRHADHQAFLKVLLELENRIQWPTSSDVGRLVDLAAACAHRLGRGGLLIVFDEFGQTIEKSIARGDHTDMHAIQEIAEAANRSGAACAFMS